MRHVFIHACIHASKRRRCIKNIKYFTKYFSKEALVTPFFLLCNQLQLDYYKRIFNSAILLTFIKLPFVINIFVWSIFEWPFYIGFTVFETLKNVHLLNCLLESISYKLSGIVFYCYT